jgi:hypothetical protein
MNIRNENPGTFGVGTGANIVFRGKPLLILNSEEVDPSSPNLHQKPAALALRRRA